MLLELLDAERHHPRPVNGIFVAITVMNKTLASRGKLAIKTTASATCFRSIRGSTFLLPSAWRMPEAMRSVISDAALPISIWLQAISNGLPSSEIHFVRPEMACLVQV